jgi:Rieske Fe-S protein
MKETPCTRRTFLLEGGKTALSVAMVSPLIKAGLLAKSKSVPVDKEPIVIDLSKPENAVLKIDGGAKKIIEPLYQKKPIIVTRISETEVAAYSSSCAHWGCEVPLPVDRSITCPCHGSTYDQYGKVTHGPASKNLRAFSATLNGSFIIIKDDRN